MKDQLRKLYEKMAEMTNKQCQIDCAKWKGTIGSCCSKQYCEIAIKNAKEEGLELLPIGPLNRPLIGKDGCIAPPHLRPMCARHVCEKSFINNKEFTQKYFELLNEIEELENEVWTKEQKKQLQTSGK